jgi:hypothetical protein
MRDSIGIATRVCSQTAALKGNVAKFGMTFFVTLD